MSATRADSSGGGRRLTIPDKDLRRVSKMLHNLIQRLRASDGSDEGDDGSAGSARVMFSCAHLGGVLLTGREAALDDECLAAVIELHGKSPEHRHVSVSATKTLLNTTILRSIRPKKKPATTDTFQRRLTRELRAFRKQLIALPTEWEVYTRVFGLGDSGLPLKFGDVKFVVGNTRLGRAAATKMSFALPRRMSKKRLAEEREVRAESKKEVATTLSTGTFAVLRVRASDGEAARMLAAERVRHAVDILNFFAPFFERAPYAQRAYVAPEGQRASAFTLAVMEDEKASWSQGGWNHDDPITEIQVRSKRASEVGLKRAGQLFAKTAPTDLEQRILNALAWAGRATVAHRRDEAFLFFTIALEALLTKPGARGGVTERVRMRTARIIGRVPAGRKRVSELMQPLYQARSELVHSGSSLDVTPDDLKLLRTLVSRTLTAVLTDRRFKSIATSKGFEDWFEDQLFA